MRRVKSGIGFSGRPYNPPPNNENPPSNVTPSSSNPASTPSSTAPSATAADQKPVLMRREATNPQPVATGEAEKAVEVVRSPFELSMADIAHVDDGVFDEFAAFPKFPRGEQLAFLSGSGAFAWWCSGKEFVPRGVSSRWDLERRESEELSKLDVFNHRRRIVEAIQKNDVTVVISPTGSGKSLMAGLLLGELMRLRDKEDESLPFGVTLCPSSAHAINTVEQSEKMYMTYTYSYCNIVNFVNPFEKADCSLEKNKYLEPSKMRGAPELAVMTYRGALNAFSGSGLRVQLLVIDEAHSTKPELLILLAYARKLLQSGRVKKLVLTSATLDHEELRSFYEYFADKRHYTRSLSLHVVDLPNERRNQLTMSCPRLRAGVRTRAFVETRLSAALTADFSPRRRLTNHLPSSKEEALEQFGKQEGSRIPEMNRMLPYTKQALDRAMEEATKILVERLRQCKDASEVAMPSILVILPGREHIDRMRSTVSRWVEQTIVENGVERTVKIYEYKYYVYQDRFEQPAFTTQRLKSTVNNNGQKNEQEKRREAAARKREEERNRGPWGGPMGTITFATPTAAEGITLKDVAFVIDAGLQRIPDDYSSSGMRSLVLTWIDGRMLLQRAGRCGRTTNGEYFICASGGKVAEILSSNIKELLLERNFDELSWFRAKEMGFFDELLWTPPASLTNEFRKSFMIRGAWRNGEFTEDAKLLHRFFPFLQPEQARFVVMGVRMGLAAHVICYVAEHIVSHPLSGRPTKITENYQAIGDEEAYDTFVNVNALLRFEEKRIRPYDFGDSVAKADYVVTWLRHTFPTQDVEYEPDFDAYEAYKHDEKALAKQWAETEEKASTAPDGVFWSGRWCMAKDEANRDDPIGMQQLQRVLIRSDGREAVCNAVRQISRVCQRLGLIKDRGSLLDLDHNRYLIANNNYNLNENGRALFRALLTMNSDKLAQAVRHQVHDKWGAPSHIRWDRFEICADFHDFKAAYIFPNRSDWKERRNKSTATFVRFWGAFKKTHGNTFNGSLDPLTTAQAAFFMNINGMAHKPVQTEAIKIDLNASPMCIDIRQKDGIFIKLDRDLVDRVWMVREKLQTVTAIMLRRDVRDDRDLFEEFAHCIIFLWKELGGTDERVEILEEWVKKGGLLALEHGKGVPVLQVNQDESVA